MDWVTLKVFSDLRSFDSMTGWTRILRVFSDPNGATTLQSYEWDGLGSDRMTLKAPSTPKSSTILHRDTGSTQSSGVGLMVA